MTIGIAMSLALAGLVILLLLAAPVGQRIYNGYWGKRDGWDLGYWAAFFSLFGWSLIGIPVLCGVLILGSIFVNMIIHSFSVSLY